MTKALTWLLTIGLMLLLPAYVNADLYHWVDKEGVVHFSDTPPAGVQKVETIETPEYAPAQPEPEAPPADPRIEDDAEPTATPDSEKNEEKRRSGPVELYTTSWCRYCKEAAAFLRQNNIAFQEFDVEKDRDAAKRMLALGGSGGVPFALINGRTVSGFSPQLYKKVLGLR